LLINNKTWQAAHFVGIIANRSKL